MTQPMESGEKKTVISLCSSYGANAIGFQQAGFDVRVAVDLNEEVAKVFRSNFPQIPFVEKDIKNLCGEGLLRIAQVDKYELDVLEASPPVHLQARPSRIPDNQRTENILWELGRLIEEAYHKVFVIDNAPSLAVGKTRLMLNEILESYEEIGYRVEMEVLNAEHYQVPQRRERLFIVGVRSDLGVKPTFPEALETRVTTRQAIGDLTGEPADAPLTEQRQRYVDTLFRPGCTAKEVRAIASSHGIKVQGANYKRDRWEEAYYELKKNALRPIHPLVNRSLTLKEVMRLQTFPEDFILSGNPQFDWIKTCSANPPTLIKHVADNLRKEILEKLK